MSRLNLVSIIAALTVCAVYVLAWCGVVTSPHPAVGAAWTGIAAFWMWMQGRTELEPPVRSSRRDVNE